MNTYYVAGIPYTSELYHHGIKGQKWGIRRFQNPDGTLTAEGKLRMKYNMRDARKELGFKEKGFLSPTESHLARNYKSYRNAAVRQGKKGDKKVDKGKDPRKNYERGLKFAETAAQYKNMAKKYNSLTYGEQQSLNAGMRFAETAGLLAAGGLGMGIASELYGAHLRNRLS